MRLRDAAYLLVCALVSISASAQTKPQIASTSLCGDSYLLAVVPDQISALSWQSRDPLSLASEPFQELPQIWDDPEILATASADIILFGPGEGSKAGPVLNARNIKRADLVWGEDFETVAANLEMIGQATGAVDKSDKAISNLNNRLETLSRRFDNKKPPPKILYLSRSGGSAGTGTLVDAAIRAAGGDNVLDTPGWVTLETEDLITLEPDLIIISFFEAGYESVNAAGIRHKAVKQFINRHEKMSIPGNLWPCAGPHLINAAEMIAARLDELP